MKILLFSDLHLDASTAGMPRWDDLIKALDEVHAAALAERVDLVIFAGDWCDPGVKASRCGARAVYESCRYTVAGIRNDWLPGNHCVQEDGTGSHVLLPIKAMSMVHGFPSLGHVHDVPAVECIGDVNFLWLPYAPRATAYDPAEVVAKLAPHMAGRPQIVVGHLNLEGIGPGSETTDMPRGRDVFWPLEALAEHLPDALLIGGHYHQRQTFKGVHIVGSLERLTFGEEADDAKGWMIVEVDGERTERAERAPRRKRRAKVADDRR